jgi:Protein of unknown function (DUF1036)
MTMPLRFRNATGTSIWIAIAYRDGHCTGSKWRKEGWWEIRPRSTITAYTGPTKNQKFYYYAYHEGHTWTWPKIKTIDADLPSHVFDRCWDEPGGERRRMGDFIADADDYTMELYR